MLGLVSTVYNVLGGGDPFFTHDKPTRGLVYISVHMAFEVKYTATLVKREEGGWLTFQCIRRLYVTHL